MNVQLIRIIATALSMPVLVQAKPSGRAPVYEDFGQRSAVNMVAG